ncbi:hypothetical protein PWA37_001439 [Arxiozyma heterogenica]
MFFYIPKVDKLRFEDLSR